MFNIDRILTVLDSIIQLIPILIVLILIKITQGAVLRFYAI